MTALPPSADTQPKQSTGIGIRVSFPCPECEHAGWVLWENLALGMHCPACGCRFSIDNTGRLRATRKVRSMRFACPRCGQIDRVPSGVLREVQCQSCDLRLVRGPDDRLHTPQQAEELRKAAAESQRAQWQQQRNQRDRRPGGPPPRWLLALLAACVALPLAGGAAWLCLSSGDDATVRRFAQQCLQADWDAAETLLPDDDLARMEFRRWRAIEFSSLVAAVRPEGDRVTVVVEPEKADEESRVYRVTLKSPFMGERSHRQHWRKDEAGWRFDPAATLAESQPSAPAPATRVRVSSLPHEDEES